MDDARVLLHLFLAVLIVGICVLFSGGIYVAVPVGDSVAAYKMNKFTGRTELIRLNKTQEVYTFE